MAIIRIPHAQLFPSTGAAPPAGRAAQETAFGVADLAGSAAKTLSDVVMYRRRQTALAARNLMSKIDVEADTKEANMLANPDLHEMVDDTGKTGFQKAPEDYAKHLEEVTQEAASKLPRDIRGAFLDDMAIKNAKKIGSFERQVIDMEQAHNLTIAKEDIRAKVTGIGPIDPATGQPAYRVAPDPIGGLQEALARLPFVPTNKREELIDYAYEQTVYGLMTVDPEGALDFLQTHQNAFDQKQWRSLMDQAQSNLTAEKTWQYDYEQRQREYRLDKIDQAYQSGNFSEAMNLAHQAPELADDEATRDKWAEYGREAAKQTTTKPSAKTDATVKQLEAIVDPHKAPEARDEIAELRFGKSALSQEDYANIRNLSERMDPHTAAVALGLVKSVRDRTVRGLRRLGLFKGDSERVISDTTDYIMGEIEQAQAQGRPIDLEQIDTKAMQFAKLQEQQAFAKWQQQQRDASLPDVDLFASSEPKAPKNEAEKLEAQLTKDDDRSVDDIISWPRDAEQAALAQKLVDIRQQEGTGGNVANKVRMIDPEGRAWDVAADEVNEAKKHGWKPQ